jgi:hypothetical protein
MRAKPGRRGIDALMTPMISAKEARVIAPASMTPAAKRLFKEIVDSCDPSHFRDAEIPLLQSYVVATLMARSTANKPKQFSTFEKAARLQKSLATSLRLSPSTRTHPEKLARQGGKPRNESRPWEDADDDDDHTNAMN